MGIEATSSTSSTATATVTAASVSVSSRSATQKTSSESFKNEMDKVSDNSVKEADNSKESETKETSKKENKIEDKSNSENKDNSVDNKQTDKVESVSNINQNVEQIQNNLDKLSLNQINSNLTSDIWQMMSSNIQAHGCWSLGLEENSTLSPLIINEDDAQFFLNLTQTEDVSIANIISQAQSMIDNGVDVEQVQKSSQVSQTLLEALNTAREKNQPIRVDFDQNVAVILRVNQNGQIAAHFIPGDKAVEQYLRNNIESLRNTFEKNDLPYSDLSYSNSSKEQNQRRRNQQQGE